MALSLSGDRGPKGSSTGCEGVLWDPHAGHLELAALAHTVAWCQLVGASACLSSSACTDCPISARRAAACSAENPAAASMPIGLSAPLSAGRASAAEEAPPLGSGSRTSGFGCCGPTPSMASIQSRRRTPDAEPLGRLPVGGGAAE
jgi:hypothetical protein